MKRILWLFTALFILGVSAQNSDVSGSSLQGNNQKIYFAVESETTINSQELTSIKQSYNFQVKKGLTFSETDYHNLESRMKRLGKSIESVTRLRLIYQIEIGNVSTETLNNITSKIAQIKGVRYASIVNNEPIVPPSDIPPQTPNYRPQQMYYAANPGINMDYAHGLGLNGSGFRIRDVEYGFNKNHEEFAHQNQIQLAPGMTVNSGAYQSYIDHGTATTGVMVADNGDYGVSGLLYGASEFLLFPEWQESGYDRILAIQTAIAASTQGDLILYEMQTYGETATGYVMQEFNAVSWDLTKAATDSGIIIVAAAGNGNQNIDGSFYADYMNRGDSGAIIVGAGTADLNHNKVWYSNYGQRIDLQGWGSLVLSTGYGEFAAIGSDYNQYYTNFEGTSSATPMVGACALALQQFYFEQTGDYLSPQEIRTILKETGIPQGTGGNIGPLPNMEAALQRLEEQLNVNRPQENMFTIYPNPARNSIRVHGSFYDVAAFEIYDVLGHQVQSGKVLPSQEINIESLSNGMYWVKLQYQNKTLTKKLLKQ